MIILRQKQYAEEYQRKEYPWKKYEPKKYEPKKFLKSELNKLGLETDKNIREVVKGTKVEAKVIKILKKSEKEMKEAAQREYSKQNREVVPADIAEKGKKSGVVQKDHNGDWRIISYKTNPPTFWPAHYSSKEKAEAALRGYQANK